MSLVLGVGFCLVPASLLRASWRWWAFHVGMELGYVTQFHRRAVTCLKSLGRLQRGQPWRPGRCCRSPDSSPPRDG